jgi:hypothetical protein
MMWAHKTTLNLLYVSDNVCVQDYLENSTLLRQSQAQEPIKLQSVLKIITKEKKPQARGKQNYTFLLHGMLLHSSIRWAAAKSVSRWETSCAPLVLKCEWTKKEMKNNVKTKEIK